MLEKNIERIADALERIATCMEKPGVIAGPQDTGSNVVEAVEAETEEKQPETERQKVMQELDTLGIEYSKRTSTVNLKAKLEKVKSNPIFEDVQEDVQEEAVEEPKPEVVEPKKEITFEEAKGALKNYALAHGNDAAKELLSQFKATKLSELSNGSLTELYNMIKTTEEV